jgi:hypothetical protein
MGLVCGVVGLVGCARLGGLLIWLTGADVVKL